jgi:hypothetical protein
VPSRSEGAERVDRTSSASRSGRRPIFHTARGHVCESVRASTPFGAAVGLAIAAHVTWEVAATKAADKGDGVPSTRHITVVSDEWAKLRDGEFRSASGDVIHYHVDGGGDPANRPLPPRQRMPERLGACVARLRDLRPSLLDAEVL